MDSKIIANELEKRHPEPSLRLDSPKIPQAIKLINDVSQSLRPVWMPKVPGNLLPERSAEYFVRTRSEAVEMPLDQYTAHVGAEKCWDSALKAMGPLSAFVDETDGPFVEGKEVSYADFYIVSVLHFIRRIDEQDFQRLTAGQKPLLQQLEACAKYFEKDS